MNEVENIRNDSVSELRASFLPIINHQSDEHSQNMQDTNIISTPLSGKQLRKCATYLICSSLAKDCGGWKRKYCIFHKNGELNMPNDDTFYSLKRDHKNNSFRCHMQNKRKIT